MNFEFMTIDTPLPPCMPFPRALTGFPVSSTAKVMAQGKGPGYERWAKIYNLKQMAAALQFLQENGLTDYAELAAKTDAAVDQEHALAGELRAVQEELTHTAALMGAVVQYAKTRPVFDGYKAAKYSKKYLAQHEAELADYREAKATMNDLLDGAKLPKMDALKQKRRELVERKKALTAQYRAAQKEMRELVTAKGNIDHLINLTGGRADKEQTREGRFRRHTYVTLCPKVPGLGRLPNKHFRGALGLAKMASVSTLAQLAITRSPENGCISRVRGSSA